MKYSNLIEKLVKKHRRLVPYIFFPITSLVACTFGLTINNVLGLTGGLMGNVVLEQRVGSDKAIHILENRIREYDKKISESQIYEYVNIGEIMADRIYLSKLN